MVSRYQVLGERRREAFTLPFGYFGGISFLLVGLHFLGLWNSVFGALRYPVLSPYGA